MLNNINSKFIMEKIFINIKKIKKLINMGLDFCYY